MKATYTRTEDSVIAQVGKQTFELKFSEIHADVIKPLVLRGASDKTRDKHAGAKTEAEIIEAIKESFDNLRDGVFNARAGGQTILAEALARIKKIDVVQAKAAIAKLDDEQLASLNAHAGIKAEVAKIRSERAAVNAKGADLSELDDLLKV
jgi:hypothetical protein